MGEKILVDFSPTPYSCNFMLLFSTLMSFSLFYIYSGHYPLIVQEIIQLLFILLVTLSLLITLARCIFKVFLWLVAKITPQIVKVKITRVYGRWRAPAFRLRKRTKIFLLFLLLTANSYVLTVYVFEGLTVVLSTIWDPLGDHYGIYFLGDTSWDHLQAVNHWIRWFKHNWLLGASQVIELIITNSNSRVLESFITSIKTWLATSTCGSNLNYWGLLLMIISTIIWVLKPRYWGTTNYPLGPCSWTLLSWFTSLTSQLSYWYLIGAVLSTWITANATSIATWLVDPLLAMLCTLLSALYSTLYNLNCIPTVWGNPDALFGFTLIFIFTISSFLCMVKMNLPYVFTDLLLQVPYNPTAAEKIARALFNFAFIVLVPGRLLFSLKDFRPSDYQDISWTSIFIYSLIYQIVCLLWYQCQYIDGWCPGWTPLVQEWLWTQWACLPSSEWVIHDVLEHLKSWGLHDTVVHLESAHETLITTYDEVAPLVTCWFTAVDDLGRSHSTYYRRFDGIDTLNIRPSHFHQMFDDNVNFWIEIRVHRCFGVTYNSYHFWFKHPIADYIRGLSGWNIYEPFSDPSFRDAYRNLHSVSAQLQSQFKPLIWGAVCVVLCLGLSTIIVIYSAQLLTLVIRRVVTIFGLNYFVGLLSSFLSQLVFHPQWFHHLLVVVIYCLYLM